MGSLPTGISSYRQFARAFPSSGLVIRIRVTGGTDHSATSTIEFLDQAGALVARIDGYQCVMDATLEGSFALNQLAQ